MSQDRPDTQFATGVICRDMARPTMHSICKLKKLARYVKGTPRCVMKYVGVVEDELRVIYVHVDSDWVGDKSSRKSTSGGLISWGGGYMKSWSTRQSCIAKSSGEAELYALSKGVAEAMGLKAVLADLGWAVEVRAWTDSSSAKSIASRTGLCKTRHIEVQHLWIQDVVRRGLVQVKRVRGTANVAGTLTKPK